VYVCTNPINVTKNGDMIGILTILCAMYCGDCSEKLGAVWYITIPCLIAYSQIILIQSI
jgi:hypothetical protein